MTALLRDRLVWRALAVVAAARALGAAAVLYATHDVGAPFTRGLEVWDGFWYLRIVEHGYPTAVAHPAALEDGIVAFFPGFPALASALHRATGLSPTAAAYSVVLIAGTVAAVALALLVRDLHDERAALRAVALLCLFPGAFTLSLLYSEALMLAGVIVCLLALHRRWWIAAGVAGAVAAVSRPTGIAIVVACAWETVRAVRERGEWRSVWATVLPPIGLVAYFAHLWRQTGEAGVYFRVQREVFHDSLSFGRGIWETIVRPHDSFGGEQQLILALALGFIAIAGVLLVRSHLPTAQKLFVPAVLVLPVLLANVGPRPRYVLVAVPLIVALANRVRGVAYAALLTSSTAGMVALLVIHVQRSPELLPFTYPLWPSP